MMLYKLSLKNIKKSFKDYAIYFFTLILGVAIFYVFNAIDSQTVMLDVTSSTGEIIKLMIEMLSGVSVFVSFILGFLIIYASRFLMKRRNKEFGIYLTLGMSKRKISMILFFETLFIGIISLVIGLGIGVILSQFMSLLVANMFEANLKEFVFTFSMSACLKTMIYFGIMYLLVMIFNTVNVSRCQLIDLIYGHKKSELIKLKNPILCILVFMIAALALGYAYYMVTGGIHKIESETDILIPILLGSISTFLIFWSLSGLVLKIVMSMKKIYYKGLNSFVLRQISSKINTMVFSMTVICLMLFVTICVLSSSLSIKNSMTNNLKSLAPADIQISYYRDLENDNICRVSQYLKEENYETNKYLKDIDEISVYLDSHIMLKDTLGDYYIDAKKQFPFLQYETYEEMMKVSDYNKLAKHFGFQQISLNDHEYCIIADYGQMINLRNEALKMKTPLHLNNQTYYPKYQTCQEGYLYMSGNHTNTGFFVVPDQALEKLTCHEHMLVANYKAKDNKEKQKIEDNLIEVAASIENVSYSINSKLDIYEASVGLGALVTFIGLYLGIIFLMSSAAILALKELSESSDNKERYQMLRKIGTDEKMINQALFRQIAIFFMFPLILAIIHSVFGIMFCNYILETFGNEGLLPSIIMTAIFVIIIYGGYFVITYLCSKNIIKEKSSMIN